MNKNELEQYLNNYEIPIKKWGIGVSKTVNHLLNELNNGESIIEVSKEGLVRKEKGVALNIYYQDGKTLLKLFEIEQRFKDGRIKKRNLSTSIGEKMKPGENPVIATGRALTEELGIENPQKIIEDIKFITLENKPVASESFPGLFTQRKIHIADIYLSEEYYKQEGYIERQPDKTTIFEWKKVE